jgi:hypothetical protein
VVEQIGINLVEDYSEPTSRSSMCFPTAGGIEIITNAWWLQFVWKIRWRRQALFGEDDDGSVSIGDGGR